MKPDALGRLGGAADFGFLGSFFCVFFALLAIFKIFLTHLKPWCVFSMIFFDFGSIFRSFGRDLETNFDQFFVFSLKIAILLKRAKTLKKPRFLQCFLRFELLEIISRQ